MITDCFRAAFESLQEHEHDLQTCTDLDAHVINVFDVTDTKMSRARPSQLVGMAFYQEHLTHRGQPCAFLIDQTVGPSGGLLVDSHDFRSGSVSQVRHNLKWGDMRNICMI